MGDSLDVVALPADRYSLSRGQKSPMFLQFHDQSCPRIAISRRGAKVAKPLRAVGASAITFRFFLPSLPLPYGCPT